MVRDWPIAKLVKKTKLFTIRNQLEMVQNQVQEFLSLQYNLVYIFPSFNQLLHSRHIGHHISTHSNKYPPPLPQLTSWHLKILCLWKTCPKKSSSKKTVRYTCTISSSFVDFSNKKKLYNQLQPISPRYMQIGVAKGPAKAWWISHSLGPATSAPSCIKETPTLMGFGSGTKRGVS